MRDWLRLLVCAIRGHDAIWTPDYADRACLRCDDPIKPPIVF